MNIIISGASEKPIYQQVYEQLSAQIIRGELPPGTMLPPIRTVAKQLRVSVITIKKAWEDLEREGLLHSMVGRGCFVADVTTGDLRNKLQVLLDTKMAKDVAYYKEHGISREEVLQAVNRHYDAQE